MKKIHFAIIGCGYWGPNFIRLINEADEAELVCVCDLSEARFTGIKAPAFTTDINDILNNGAIDAVIICTPVSTHYSVSKACLQAGKHVLCEKPLCTEVSDAKELKQIAIQQKVILMAGHVFEYNAVVRKLKTYIGNDSFGQLLYIHMNRNGLGPVRNDVNVFYDLGAHDISIALYLLGQMPVAVVAQGSSFINGGNIDIGFITLYFDNNILVQISNSWLDAIKQREIKVVGTKQMLLFDDVSLTEKLKIFQTGISYQKDNGDFGSFQLSVKDGDTMIPNINYPEPLKEELNHFISCINSGTEPLTNADNAIRVVRVLEAVNESLQQNGKKIFIHA